MFVFGSATNDRSIGLMFLAVFAALLIFWYLASVISDRIKARKDSQLEDARWAKLKRQIEKANGKYESDWRNGLPENFQIIEGSKKAV